MVARPIPPCADNHCQAQGENDRDRDAHGFKLQRPGISVKRKSWLPEKTPRPVSGQGGDIGMIRDGGSLGALDQQGALADALAQVVELRAADFSAVDHLDFGDPRRVDRENALDAFAV